MESFVVGSEQRERKRREREREPERERDMYLEAGRQDP
jgi:hypothetical protein